MSYIESTMADNEKIEKIFKLHWVNYIKGVLYLVASVPLVIAGFHYSGTDLTSSLFLLTLLATVLAAAPFFLILRSVEQGVTNRKLVYKKGVISRETSEIILDAIQTVEMSQTFIGRILNFGDVKVIGRGTGEIVFKKIADPINVKKSIENMIEKYN